MIGALLRGPGRAIVARIDRDLRAAGYDDLRPAHFVVFQQIEPAGSRLTDLAERAQITKQSMGYLVDYLETHGYVERAPDPEDGRARIIRLTARGWNLDRDARAIMACIEAEWANRLGVDRFEQLRQTLKELGESPES
jgi:DNA-binding MarR family transcriptional regulator